MSPFLLISIHEHLLASTHALRWKSNTRESSRLTAYLHMGMGAKCLQAQHWLDQLCVITACTWIGGQRWTLLNIRSASYPEPNMKCASTYYRHCCEPAKTIKILTCHNFETIWDPVTSILYSIVSTTGSIWIPIRIWTGTRRLVSRQLLSVYISVSCRIFGWSHTWTSFLIENTARDTTRIANE